MKHQGALIIWAKILPTTSHFTNIILILELRWSVVLVLKTICNQCSNLTRTLPVYMRRLQCRCVVCTWPNVYFYIFSATLESPWLSLWPLVKLKGWRWSSLYFKSFQDKNCGFFVRITMHTPHTLSGIPGRKQDQIILETHIGPLGRGWKSARWFLQECLKYYEICLCEPCLMK